MGSFAKILRFMSHIQPLWKFPRRKKMKIFNYSFTLQNHRFSSNAKCPSRCTIFALSTPPGVSAIAVIRISGPNASDVLLKMGKIKKFPEARKATLCRIKDPVSKELLDSALVLWFPSPNSFTSEDMCELHIHGGIAVVKSVLSALIKMPHFRMAEPGEFTKRAFLANKLDLTEVEGLSNLLHAETEIQQKQALRQMDGSLNKLYNDWSSRIKKCLANVEAYIDFSEDQQLEDTILKSVQSDLEKLKVEMKSHISDCRRGERLRTGVNVVLIGKPNVGKSSLLNNLCQRDIAIVSPTAGTTRDIIETSFNLDGYLVNISDTAGIRETLDSIELEGVKRAKNRSLRADLLLFIVEAKRALEIYESSRIWNENFANQLLVSELGESFLKDLKRSNNENENSNITTLTSEIDDLIILLNKIDLLSEEEKAKVLHLEKRFDVLCAISCTEGFGMNKFLHTFTDAVKKMCSNYKGEEPIITQERHRIFIANCLQNIISYEDCLKMDIALAAEKLRVAMNEIGKITGKVRIDDILDVVFKDFCIGK